MQERDRVSELRLRLAGAADREVHDAEGMSLVRLVVRDRATRMNGKNA
jgi:hypothetical protein